MNFEGMPKIARLNKEIIVTEKIDGTNAQIAIECIPNSPNREIDVTSEMLLLAEQDNGDLWILRAGSKNRFLTVENDNFGFAKWAYDNAHHLIAMGPGVHRGEWWGNGIQRGYGLDHKLFSLFNVSRWVAQKHGATASLNVNQEYAPICCHVVPVLGRGIGFQDIEMGLLMLRDAGSMAAPGFMNPEGLVAFHTGNGAMFKATLENDVGKWADEVSPSNIQDAISEMKA